MVQKDSSVVPGATLDPESGAQEPDIQGNAQAYSVSELAFALKRTIEDAYGFVRLRGEISKVTRHASGHIYLSIKDDKAVIDGVVWKGSVRGLACQPQTGLEVVVTGRITTYPARSSYQLVIESMAPAGVGALLAQLERLKARLQAEGLFDPERKRPLPSMPSVIGVITSPTGAVIRDILHRIADRWPAHVMVWPVVVQGADAAAQVAAAIRGFNAIGDSHLLRRPDLLIVARGGGSVEDLWPFNDEALARAVAEGIIPLISAVGHETDTTLIDFVSDRRAPTPTAAAEMGTPVLADLKLQLLGLEQRMTRCTAHALEVRRTRLSAAARGLPKPQDMIGLASQRFDLAAGRLGAALQRNTSAHERDLLRTTARLSPRLLERPVQMQTARVAELGQRLQAATERRLATYTERLSRIDQLRRSVDPDRPLHRGFARVHQADGALVRSAAALKSGDSVRLIFADGDRGAVVDGMAGGAPPAALPAKRAPKPPSPSSSQGDLF